MEKPKPAGQAPVPPPVAASLNGLTERKVLCHLPGGDLTLEWADSDEVFMTGPAAEVFTGDWPL